MININISFNPHQRLHNSRPSAPSNTTPLTPQNFQNGLICRRYSLKVCLGKVIDWPGISMLHEPTLGLDTHGNLNHNGEAQPDFFRKLGKPYVYTYTYTYMHIHIHTHTHVYIYTHISVYIYKYLYMHIQIDIYIWATDKIWYMAKGHP